MLMQDDGMEDVKDDCGAIGNEAGLSYNSKSTCPKGMCGMIRDKGGSEHI